MLCENNSDDSDSGSLPDLSQIFKLPQTEISTGDIVWAKFKHLYWPALVRAVYPKQKKITIWYADEPGKTFKLPLKNVCRFHDAAMRVKIQKDVKEAGCLHEHDGLTSHATRYLLRKSEGYKDDPMKFFDQTYPFFLVEEWKKKNPGADVSNIKIPPLYISYEKKASIRKSINAHKDVSDDSEVESTDSEGVLEEKAASTDYVTKVNVQLQENSSDPSKIEFLDKIVECVLSGKADDYLQKIMSKSIPSEHHDIYEQSLKCNKKGVSYVTYTGPIEDDDKLRKLIFYLLPLYDNASNIHNSKRRSPRKSKNSISTYSFSRKSDEAQYVASVWLPESIIFAISIVKNVSLHEARQLFNEKPESKTKVVESILASLDTLSSESDVADCTSKSDEISTAEDCDKDHNEAVKHSSDSEICSPLKKMCVDRSGTVKNVDANCTNDLELSLETSDLSGDLKSVEMYDESKYVSEKDNEVEGPNISEKSNQKCDVSCGKSSRSVQKRSRRYKIKM